MSEIMILPGAAIEQAKNACKFHTKIVTHRTKPADYIHAKEEIEENLERFDLLAKQAIARTDGDSKQAAESCKKYAERCIIISALSEEFLAKHHEEIREAKTKDALLDLLDDIIGTLTEAQIRSAAEEKLNNLTRDSDNEEKFVRFYNRIERLAKNSTGKGENDKHIRSHLIKKTFFRNITPKLKTFLHEHDKNSLSANEAAVYLDKMLKYKRSANLYNLENSETAAQMTELQQQNTHLQQQNIDLHQKMDGMQKLLATLLENQNATKHSMDLQINELRSQRQFKTPKPAPKIHQTSFKQPSSAPTGNNTNANQPNPQRYINPNWELNKYGAPYTCRKCGIRGHRDENCRGTNLACHICQQTGHIQTVCPQRPNKQKNMPKNL